MTKDEKTGSPDLLNYLLAQASERKDWFSFSTQRITSIALAHDIAANHADKLSPTEAVEYAIELNQQIYDKIIQNRK